MARVSAHSIARWSEERTMELEPTWQGTIQVAVPVEDAYRYLADIPRHADWSQTVVRQELLKPGDARGVGAVYLTHERQAFQSDRQPKQPITKGFKGKTICEVRELEPNRRIAWHSHPKPRMGISSDWVIALAPAEDGGTQVTQRCRFQENAFARLLSKAMRMTPEKAAAQWDASLRNIKLVLEEDAGGARHSNAA
jgi:uncharacterized protein YndB with AHSA1/START domain